MYKEGMSVSKMLRTIKSTDAGQYILKELGFEKTIDKELKSYAARALLGMEAVAPVTEGVLQGIYEINKATFIDQIRLSAKEVQKELMNTILTGASRSSLVERIGKLDSTLRADQIQTIISTMQVTYMRQVQAYMGRELPESTLYVYAGPIDDKTRPICLEMAAAGELTMSEIEERFPGAFINGGGFNCRHHWRTVTKFTKETGLSNPEEARRRLND
jgi:hypothetical protein